MFDIFNQSGLDLGPLEGLIQEFMPFAQERHGFKNPPKLFLLSDEKNAADPLGKTGGYNPDSMDITIYVSGRHPKDILRSLSHELVHHNQNERGDLSDVLSTALGYAQEDPHMREMEREAYEQGNLCLRDWEDGRKKQLQESIYYETIIGGNDMSEQRPLKEWKDNEINFRLMKKFGLIKEEGTAGNDIVVKELDQVEDKRIDEDEDEDGEGDDDDGESTSGLKESTNETLSRLNEEFAQLLDESFWRTLNPKNWFRPGPAAETDARLLDYFGEAPGRLSPYRVGRPSVIEPGMSSAANMPARGVLDKYNIALPPVSSTAFDIPTGIPPSKATTVPRVEGMPPLSPAGLRALASEPELHLPGYAVDYSGHTAEGGYTDPFYGEVTATKGGTPGEQLAHEGWFETTPEVDPYMGADVDLPLIPGVAGENEWERLGRELGAGGKRYGAVGGIEDPEAFPGFSKKGLESYFGARKLKGLDEAQLEEKAEELYGLLITNRRTRLMYGYDPETGMISKAPSIKRRKFLAGLAAAGLGGLAWLNPSEMGVPGATDVFYGPWTGEGAASIPAEELAKGPIFPWGPGLPEKSPLYDQPGVRDYATPELPQTWQKPDTRQVVMPIGAGAKEQRVPYTAGEEELVDVPWYTFEEWMEGMNKLKKGKPKKDEPELYENIPYSYDDINESLEIDENYYNTLFESVKKAWAKELKE